MVGPVHVISGVAGGAEEGVGLVADLAAGLAAGDTEVGGGVEVKPALALLAEDGGLAEDTAVHSGLTEKTGLSPSNIQIVT